MTRDPHEITHILLSSLGNQPAMRLQEQFKAELESAEFTVLATDGDGKRVALAVQDSRGTVLRLITPDSPEASPSLERFVLPVLNDAHCVERTDYQDQHMRWKLTSISIEHRALPGGQLEVDMLYMDGEDVETVRSALRGMSKSG